MTALRTMTGEAGADHRGLWIDDADTGTRARLGMVGYELAEDLIQHNRRTAHQALSNPHFGAWFSKTF